MPLTFDEKRAVHRLIINVELAAGLTTKHIDRTLLFDSARAARAMFDLPDCRQTRENARKGQ